MTPLERRARIALTLPHIAGLDPDDAELLLNWLPNTPGQHGNQTHVTAVVDAGLRRVTVLVDGPAATAEPEVERVLADLGTAPDEVSWMRDMAQRLDTEHLGTWLSVSSDGVDGGWHCFTTAPMTAVLDRVDHVDDMVVLRAWADEQPTTPLVRLRRSLGEPHPAIELVVDLGDQDGVVPTRLHDLFARLGVPWLGDDVIDVLEEEDVTHVDLVVTTTDAGVSALGLVIPTPSRRLALLLGPLADRAVHEHLARAEGTLGVGSPSSLSLQRVAAGWDATFSYDL